MAGNKAVLITNFTRDLQNLAGGLEVKETAIPEPTEGRVLVQISLRPIHPVDVYCAVGLYPGFQPKKSPPVCGTDGVGKVVKNGPGCSKFSEGTRVVGAPFDFDSGEGTWQQYVTVPEANLIAVPDEVSDAAAAQFPLNPMTMYGMFEVGRMVIQLAKHRGIKTISTVRRVEQREELLAIGANEVVCTSDEDLVERVKDITGGKGAAAALDCLAGETTEMLQSSVGQGGKVLIYGMMNGFKSTINAVDLLQRGKAVIGYNLEIWLYSKPRPEQIKAYEAVMALMAEGVLQPQEGPTFALEDIKEAMEASLKPGRGAKVFLSG